MTNEKKNLKILKIQKYEEKISKERKEIIVETIGISALAIIGCLTADKSTFESFALGVMPTSIISLPFLLGMASSIGAKTVYKNEKQELEEELGITRGR